MYWLFKLEKASVIIFYSPMFCRKLVIFKHAFHTGARIHQLIFLGDQSECLKSITHCNFAALDPMTLPQCFGTERGINHLSAGGSDSSQQWLNKGHKQTNLTSLNETNLMEQRQHYKHKALSWSCQ